MTDAFNQQPRPHQSSQADLQQRAATVPTARKRANLVYCAVLVGVAFAVSYNGDIDGPLDLYHEGDRVAHYDTVKAGGLPFRDYFVQHGLGEDVLKPLTAFKLWGESIASLRRLGQNTFVYRGYLPALGAAGVVFAGCVLLGGGWPAAVPFALVVAGLYEVSERPMLGFMAVAALGAYLGSGRRFWLFLAGCATGLAALYSLEVGLSTGAAATLWLLTDRYVGSGRWKPRIIALAIFLAGLGVILAPMLIWCQGKGIIPDLLGNLSLQLFRRGELWDAEYPLPAWRASESFIDNLHVSIGVISLFYLIPLTYGLGIVLGLVARGRTSSKIKSATLLCALFGACLWASVIGRPDLWHLAYAIGPFFLLVPRLVGMVRERGADLKRSRVLVYFLLALPCVFVFEFGEGGSLGRRFAGHESMILPSHLRKDDRELVESTLPRLNGLRIPADQAATLEALVHYIQAHSSAEDPILDLSDQGMIYFLSERRCPSRFHFLSHCSSPSLKQEMLDEVRAADRLPRLVILPGPNPPQEDVIGDFLRANYVRAIQIGPYQVLRLAVP
ncbi:MAG TPA: hypothetical protein VJZ71_06260 [Phycisphaerae bacterium]|nr:hypothetical protein [Phycisphaerae bacterium]